MCPTCARNKQGGQGGWSQVNKGESGRNNLGEVSRSLGPVEQWMSPQLHVRITWGAFEAPKAWAAPYNT